MAKTKEPTLDFKNEKKARSVDVQKAGEGYKDLQSYENFFQVSKVESEV